MLWVDKYRPKTLDKVIVHEDVAQNLKKLVTEQDCPHLLFYGPPGSGKKTLIMALLRQMFGPSAEKVKVENKTWKVDAGTRTIDLELTTLASTYHVELNPSDAGFQDRYIVQEIIKEMAKNRPIDTKGKKGFKVLVLNEVDKLSREAQHSLRRTMEKYSASCRLILCCNSSSKVTEAVRSRCLNVRINAPTEEQIVKVLEFIGKKEGLQLPSGFAARIAEKSNRSLRRAILAFETCRVQQYPFTSNQAIPPMDWEEYVSEIASDIMKEQSPKRLFQVRGKIYELLINCIPPEIVLKRLLFELLKKLDAELKHEVCHWAAYYEHRMRLGQKAIFHIEVYANGCSLSSRVDTKVHAFPSYAAHCGGDRPQPHSGLPQRPTFPMNELAGKSERVAGIMPSRLLLDTLRFTKGNPVMIGRFPVNSLFSKKSPVGEIGGNLAGEKVRPETEDSEVGKFSDCVVRDGTHKPDAGKPEGDYKGASGVALDTGPGAGRGRGVPSDATGGLGGEEREESLFVMSGLRVNSMSQYQQHQSQTQIRDDEFVSEIHCHLSMFFLFFYGPQQEMQQLAFGLISK
ncbi:hypothetical protein RHSIM_Rhsim03G0049600 [Rhododendron simsii]|uniref:AAA+ ATPase domain-containing protein n=1 Tax=Rhododendron simsii TaxID=118357 RepID=A0A834H862_RHOSS|nr:hypothetical protein RHSIM_Rhsim03G0049600 [Rhododendron simsii]